MASSLSAAICQFFITISIASITTTIDPDYEQPHPGDNANDITIMNTMSTDRQMSPNSPPSSGFHLPDTNKEILSWIIGGLFLWCSFTICCIIFVKRTIPKTKDRNKVDVLDVMQMHADQIIYHHAGRYTINNNENANSNSGSSSPKLIEEEEDVEEEGQDEIMNQVKDLEKRKMSKQDNLIQELKLRQLQHKQELNKNMKIEVDVDQKSNVAPQSHVANPESVKTPPPPPPPGVADDADAYAVAVAAAAVPAQEPVHIDSNPGC